ncbi:hypothetical protein [Ensifer sp. Root127]|uniref:hypothetical protein n=1 Tax=Ensifer sp. Root127 TaxID=1736440 RepID=UPI00070EB744|nr:hypothetical protein [Ensifer sp. Root127]KQW72353.1 hypothetical protein ASD03_31810 [Ensifer sp. Root127]
MKSPWKYLVELASQGRKAKEPDSPREIETSKLDETSKAPAEQTRMPLGTADGITTPTVETSNESAGIPDIAPDTVAVPADPSDKAAAVPVDQPSADNQLPPKRVQPPQERSTETRRRSQRAVRNVADVDADKREEDESFDVRPPLTFSDEVAALDEEVRQLRGQLAEKLRLQNNQLKALLERFEAW